MDWNIYNQFQIIMKRVIMNNIIDNIDFEKQDGLIPVITQDANTSEVLMLAYMNKEAVELTLKTNFVHYFSRTKQRIWKKGESSNHTQEVVSINIDCDNDTLLIKVNQKGVACHTGRKSCFFTDLKTAEIQSEIEVDTSKAYGVIETLYQTINQEKMMIKLHHILQNYFKVNRILCLKK